MKTTLIVHYTALLLFALTCVQALAITRTVSNNPNIPAQFASLQVAVDASATGDTLLIHGSAVSYGDVNVGKSLVLIGPGYRPTGQNGLAATVGDLRIFAAAAGDADNVVVLGLTISSLRPNGNTNCGNGFAVKMRLERCQVAGVSPYTLQTGPASTELFAEQCVFSGTYTGTGNCGGQGINSALISNSIFTGNYNNSSAAASAVISNCIFFGGGSTLSTIQNTILSNTIFFGTNMNSGTKTGCTFNSNLTFSTNNNSAEYGGGNITTGTIENANPQFISGPPNPAAGQNFLTLFNSGFNLNLSPGSPALSAGSDGTNIGTSGGANGFDYITQSSTRGPQMSTLIINNASLPENGTLDVNFSAKSQD